MLVETILTLDCTRSKIVGGSKKRVLEQLAQIFSHSVEDLSEDSLFQSLIGRERLGSTGIGDGIAIPHCRFATGGETSCACITLEEPVDFDSIDNKPVDVIFAMVVPEDANSEHLATLASLAEKLQKPEFVKGLRSATSDAQLFNAAVSAC